MVIVGAIAADQWGLLTTRQAVAQGLTRLQLSRLAERGHLERVSHGVYGQPVALADPNVELRAEWLALRPELTAAERLRDPATTGVVSHTSAAGLHALGSLLDDELHYSLPRPYRSRKPGVRTHRANLVDADVVILEGLPVTTIARTVTDLLAGGHDLEHVAQVLREAVLSGRMRLSELYSAADRRPDSARTRELLGALLQVAGLDEAELVARTLENPVVQQLARDYARAASEPIMRLLAGRVGPLTESMASALHAYLHGPAGDARDATLRMGAAASKSVEGTGTVDLVRNITILEQLHEVADPTRWSGPIADAVLTVVEKEATADHGAERETEVSS